MDRRDFLKTVGAGGLATGVIAPAEIEAQTGRARDRAGRGPDQADDQRPAHTHESSRG